MEQNRITYEEACPKCEAEGRKEKLFLDMDKVEIRCEVGHVFEELPSDTVLRTGLQAEPIPAVSEVVSEAKSEPEIEQVSSIADLQPEAPITNTLEKPVAPLSPSAIVAAEDAKLAKIAVQLKPRSAGPSLAAAGLMVAEGMGVTLPDGDMLLGVRIPEAWRQAVEAEAEAQMKSPGKYFSDWLTSEEMRATVIDWLQNYWCSAYSQTV